jgi:hypothetical protein
MCAENFIKKWLYAIAESGDVFFSKNKKKLTVTLFAVKVVGPSSYVLILVRQALYKRVQVGAAEESPLRQSLN